MGGGKGGGGGGVCKQIICDHIAAFVNPFNLICNMTLFLKKSNFDLLTPRVRGGGGGGGGGGSAYKILATMSG